MRANILRDQLYAIAVVISFFNKFLAIGLFELNGAKKIRYMLLGLWHGSIKKMGKVNIFNKM